jgi:hypothetical protein
MARFATALVVVAVLSLPAPNSAQAQLGGLIKKKVTEAIKGPEKQPEQKPASSASTDNSPPGFGSDVLEITEPVFAGVIRGLETELRLQAEFRQELAKYPTQAQYDECLAKVPESPEYKKIIEKLANLPENATGEQAMAASQKAAAEGQALTDKTCPVKPVDTVWPNGKKMERLEEIRGKAAEAAGSESSASNTGWSGLELALIFTYDVEPGAAFAVWNSRQYSIAIERIDRLCDYNNGPGAGGASSDGNLKIQGGGAGIFWVFTARETGVVNAANCRKFKDLTKRLM